MGCGRVKKTKLFKNPDDEDHEEDQKCCNACKQSDGEHTDQCSLSNVYILISIQLGIYFSSLQGACPTSVTSQRCDAPGRCLVSHILNMDFLKTDRSTGGGLSAHTGKTYLTKDHEQNSVVLTRGGRFSKGNPLVPKAYHRNRA